MIGLQENRQKINEIDEKLIALLEERLRASGRIGEYKREKGLDIYDPLREAERLDYVREHSEAGKADRIESIFKEIITQCRLFQEP